MATLTPGPGPASAPAASAAVAKELFISYGREPTVTQFVHKLKADLERNGFSVWLDSHDIPAGSDWHGAIGAGLSGCKAILPVLTNKYIGSRYCVNELYTADGDKKLIFPIMFEDIDFDASESGQGVKFVISAVNWTMCRSGVDDYNNSISRLMIGMKAKGLGGGDGSVSTETKSSSGPAHQPSPVPLMPLVGPAHFMPFKVIPDVENPEGITSTPDGHLVVSIMRQKVLIFNSDHEKVLELGGEPGLGMGQFLNPNGVAVDSEGNILVAGHYFLQKFSSDGKFLEQVGGTGQTNFSIDSPRGIAIGKGGRVYIAEQQKHRITILNPDLSLYKRFSDADRMLGSGHLNMPQGLAVSSEGNVYVADMMNHVVQVFDAEGTFLFRFGGMGHGPGTTTSPMAVAIDTEDNVYVASACVVSLFDVRGVFVRAFGEHGSEVGKFNTIRALHLDRNGILYVGEWTSNRIQMYNTHGSKTEQLSGQMQGLALQPASQPPPLPQQPQQTPGLQSGKGSGMVLIGGNVSIGSNVVFGGHVSIQPGANVMTPQGPVAAPVAVPPASLSGGHGQTSGSVQGGVIFAQPANVPCKQAGARQPARVLEGVKSAHSMAVSQTGELIVTSTTGEMTLFSANLEQLFQEKVPDFSSACVVVDDQNTIVVVSMTCLARLDLQLNVLSKVLKSQDPSLEPLTLPFAVAIGSNGCLYIAGSQMSHIVNADFSYCKNFANGFQAMGIAVSSSGNVYLPILDKNTIQVFSPDGDSLFEFGEPGRAPLPQMSLLAPISVALDRHDNVYVGLGMTCINKFDREGKFVEAFAPRGGLKDIPMQLCTGPHSDRLYVGIPGDDTVQIYTLED